MDEMHLKKLLEKVRDGSCDIAEALRQMKHWPSEAMDYACLDHHRSLRTGFPEVVYGADKSAEQIARIMQAMLEKPAVTMATRVNRFVTRLPGWTFMKLPECWQEILTKYLSMSAGARSLSCQLEHPIWQ